MNARKPLALPMADEAAVYGHIGRYAGQVVMTAFEMIGGVDRLADWAGKHETEFFTKLLPKVISRPVEHSVSGGVEDLLERLDREDKMRTIEGECVEITSG